MSVEGAALTRGGDGEGAGYLGDTEKRLGQTCVVIDWIKGR